MARLSDHNVVGTFPDLEKAREVIRELNDAGIDANDISMLGKQVEDVASNPDTRLRDVEATGDLAKNAATGAGAGALIGGVAGALAWVLPGVGPVLGTGIWAATGGGAIAGTVVGGMVGAIDATQLGPEWEVTYGAPLRDGKVLVAVHARDEAAAATAVEVLEGLGPDRIDHLNEDGKPLEEASEGS